MNNIKLREIQQFGHMLWGEKYKLLQLTLRGKIFVKTSRGRLRTSWLQNLREWT